MADRRMFSKTIIDSDLFLSMPASAQALYFHLSMRADDEGFLNNVRAIQRLVGASDDDLKLLLAKRYLLVFESGVVVIRHWYVHNYIQNDRAKATVHIEEKAQLTIENKTYEFPSDPVDTPCIQSVSNSDTQDSIGKDRLGKVSIDNDTHAHADAQVQEQKEYSPLDPPTREMIRERCEMRNYVVNVDSFYEYYTSRGWKYGSTRINWERKLDEWEVRDKNRIVQRQQQRDKDRPVSKADSMKGTGESSFNVDDFFNLATKAGR